MIGWIILAATGWGVALWLGLLLILRETPVHREIPQAERVPSSRPSPPRRGVPD